jgi:hypothetical protein
MVTPDHRRRAVSVPVERFGVSQRRARRVIGQHRSTQRSGPRPGSAADTKPGRRLRRAATQQKQSLQRWRSSNIRPLTELRQSDGWTDSTRHPSAQQQAHVLCPNVRYTYACPSPYIPTGRLRTPARIKTPPRGISKGQETRDETLPRRRKLRHEDVEIADRSHDLQPFVQSNEPGSAMIKSTGRLETRPETLGIHGLSALVPGVGLEPTHPFE